MTDTLDDHLRGHTRRALTLISRRLADARSHAAAGEADAASARIDELGESLAFALADARGQFYRKAFHATDPAIHDTGQVPTRDGEQVARTGPIAGRDQYRDLAAPLGEAVASLRIAAAGASSRQVAPELARAMLAGWEGRHRAALSRHVQTALSDAQMSIHYAVGQALVREEIR